MEKFTSLAEVFDSSPQVFCVLDRDLRYIYSNASHRKLFQDQDFTGKTIFEVQPEFENTIYMQIVQDVLNGKQVTIEDSPFNAGGERRFLSLTYTPRKEADGKISGFYVIGNDVTESVRNREKLEASEALLRIITNKVPAYISYTDPDGRYKFLNENYAKWFGSDPEKFIGKTRQEVIPPGYVAQTNESQKNAFTHGSSHHEVRLQKPNGEFMNLEVNYFSDTDQKGEVRGMVAVGIDITEKLERLKQLERSRRELRELFDQIPYPLFLLTGEDRRFTLTNKAFEEYNARKVEGMTLADAFAGEDISLFENFIDQVYKTGEPVSAHGVPYNFRISGGSISERFVDVHYYPYLNDDHERIGVFTIVQDVTEEIIGRRKIEALASSLQDAVIARDNFMALASHELKTPLTSMRLMNQLQQRVSINLDPATKKYYEQSLKQIDRLTRLVDDMLDISRIGKSKLEMKKVDVDLSQLVFESFEKLLPQLTQHGITVHFDLQKEIRAKIDPERFEQVFTNLATNTARYAAGKPVKVSLIQEQAWIILEVEDQGQGIPDGKAEKIFERFEQAGKQAGGFGLGLFISREIVEAHGGSISARTNEMGGATFRIVIPRV